MLRNAPSNVTECNGTNRVKIGGKKIEKKRKRTYYNSICILTDETSFFFAFIFVSYIKRCGGVYTRVLYIGNIIICNKFTRSQPDSCKTLTKTLTAGYAYYKSPAIVIDVINILLFLLFIFIFFFVI